jgi:hypothetical protein
MAQTLPHIKRQQLSEIYAIRIRLYQFFPRYNGFFIGFWLFSKKNQTLFSQERELRLPKLKLISSNERGVTKGFYFHHHHMVLGSKFYEPPLFIHTHTRHTHTYTHTHTQIP